jgi:hypothetical protein
MIMVAKRSGFRGVVFCLSALALTACAAGEKSKTESGTSALGASGPIFDDGSTDVTTIVGFDGQACAGQTAGTEVAPSVLQFLVDTSGSMNQDAPGRGSKWVQTRRALLAAIDGMPGDTSLGVVFYPNVPGNTAMPCFDRRTAVALEALDAPRQRQQIRQAFTDQNPEGGTPTHDAYDYALAELQQSSAIGQRFLVLITDGIPTYTLGCDTSGRRGNDNEVDSTPLIAAAADAQAAGVRTFVIGSPGSEGARESLSRMAEAGGTARAGCSHNGPSYCHFDMTQQNDLAAGLASALSAIAGLALSCSYDIPAPPRGAMLEPGKVNVLFTGAGGEPELIGQSPNGSCSDGWQYSADQTRIQLCGPTCERVRTAEAGGLSLQFGCATQVR